MQRNPSSAEGRNDQELIEDIYREFKWLMYSTAQKYIINKSDQEDVVQSSIEKLMKKITTLRTLSRSSLACYIVNTVKSVAVDFLRTQERQEKHTSDIWDINDQLIDSVENKIIANERLINLKNIWHLLSREEQQLLMRKYIGGHTDQELAKDFKCKPSSIRMKLTRARRKVFNFLSEEDSKHG